MTAATDLQSAQSAYNTANAQLSAAKTAADVQTAIAGFLTSAQSALAVANDVSNATAATAIQALIVAIQGAQTSANAATDATSAMPSGTVAQASASSALAQAQSLTQTALATTGGLPSWAWWVIGLLVLGGLGAAGWMLMKKPGRGHAAGERRKTKKRKGKKSKKKGGRR